MEIHDFEAGFLWKFMILRLAFCLKILNLLMHQSFVSTAPPHTGMGWDSDYRFSESCYKPRPVEEI